jgi:uncharacterized protein
VTLFFTDVVLPYLVGGLLPGLIAAIAAYYLSRPLIRTYQARRRARLLSRARERLHRAKSGAKSEADGIE